MVVKKHVSAVAVIPAPNLVLDPMRPLVENWLYYSGQIFLFGAELTRAYANRYGSRILPKDNAVAATDKARAAQGIPRAEKTARSHSWPERKR